MKIFLCIILIISFAGNLLGLVVLDRSLFYRSKITLEENAFYNKGLRTSRHELIRQADYDHLGVFLGGNLVRYWYLPSDSELPMVNLGGTEEKVVETYSKLRQATAGLAPKFVIISAGFCQIHTAVHTKRDVSSAISGNLESLRGMVDFANSQGVIPILSTLTPVRAEYLLPYTGFFERQTAENKTENEAIRQYNRQIKELSDEYNLPYFDFYSVLADEEGQLKKSYALTDGEHINQAGYQALNTFLNHQLATLLAEGTI